MQESTTMPSAETSPQTEEQIPLLAEAAIRQVVSDTRAAGLSILVREDDVLFEVLPNGTRKEIKTLPPRIKFLPGTRELRS